jgi:ammonia channel protein AmtB
MISFMSGVAASVTIFVARPIVNIIGKADEINIYDPMTVLGCFMAGLVSISASCEHVTIEMSLLIGAIGSIWFMLSKKIMFKLEIDDPLN